MKRFLLALCATGVAVTAVSSGSSVIMNAGFRDPIGLGVATAAAVIEEDNLTSSYFLFASEGGHHGPEYPDTVFRADTVTEYMQMGNQVMVMGSGRLYGFIPVAYMARFVDAGPVRGDYFEIHCWVERTNHIVHFTSYLTSGDIRVIPGK
jgi:hypothetical protein